MRRSTRQKVERQKVEAPPPPNPPSRKRAKKAAEPVIDNEPISSDRKPQRKRGKLRFMTEVPLDVLFEIFGKLLPVDLLNLSCATKALRDILLRKSAAFVWKQAFLNVPDPGPPPRPDDLNEPQYANLLWRKHCFFCGVSTQLVLWQCRVRACEACVDSPKFTDVNNGVALGPQIALGMAKTLCPRTWHRPRSRSIRTYVCLTSDLMAIQKRLEELGTNPDTQEFEVNADTEEYARQCREILATKDQTNRRVERKNKIDARKNAIVAKLEKLGWNTELANFATKRQLLALPDVNQNKELTERTWANIEPGLVEFLVEAKRQRLERQWINVLRDRVRTLNRAAHQLLDAMSLLDRLSIPDLCIMPEYRAILERPAADPERPEADPPTEEDFADALAHLSEQSDEWRKSNIDTLLGLLPSGSKKQGKKRLDASILDLCTTFFRCHSCREPICYPRILKHACLRNRQSSEETEDDENEDLLVKALSHAPWVHGQEGIAFDTEASNITSMLITLCGQDPKTLTTAAMDNVDSRFECVRCAHPTKGKLVMAWRMALLHELEDHYGDPIEATSYRLLDPDEVIAAKEREAKSKKQPPSGFVCPGCERTPNSEVVMQEHINWSHKGKSLVPVPFPDLTFRIPPFPVKLKI
ncbi:hypothetical protein C8R45DRAFT_954725 [Mycena sanguinolenta]|nr:hypothetical protein C8R45DRAFT_954725 [Mycena sanguinolenta]